MAQEGSTMKRTILITGLVLVLAMSATAADEASRTPVSEQPLHFRLEAGVTPGHIVTGWLDESKGTGKGYDCVALDRDGDGVFETKEMFPTQPHRQTKKPIPKPTVTVEQDGATWALDLYSIGQRRPSTAGGKVNCYIRWSVTKGDFYAWFINGRVNLYADAARAKTEKTIRLGPPFRFDTGATTRGPSALLRVGLKDGNGCTMRLARMGKPYRYIDVILKAGEKEALNTHPPYG
jgi:hypothetical protein